MMHMTFYWSREVTLLVDSWKTTSWTSYAFTILACFLASAFYQFLEDCRVRLKLSSSSSPSPSAASADAAKPSSAADAAPRLQGIVGGRRREEGVDGGQGGRVGAVRVELGDRVPADAGGDVVQRGGVPERGVRARRRVPSIPERDRRRRDGDGCRRQRLRLRLGLSFSLL